MHPHKILVTCCGRPEEIDVDVARVCRATWARGVHTQWTCQDDGAGNAELGFPDIGEADRFAQLVFDLGRAHATGQEPPGIKDWEWWLPKLRMPLTQRMTVNLRIPRGELDALAAWLETSTLTPEVHPVAEPCVVDPDAGMELTEDEKRRYEQLTDAFEVLAGLDDGKCYCEPSDDGEGSDHEAECPRNYDHLATAADIAAFEQVIAKWEKGTSARPEVIHGMRVGVTARAIELQRAGATS